MDLALCNNPLDQTVQHMSLARIQDDVFGRPVEKGLDVYERAGRLIEYLKEHDLNSAKLKTEERDSLAGP